MFSIHRHVFALLSVAAVAIAVSACGGGGSSPLPSSGTQPQPTQSTQPSQTKTGPANLTIYVPPATKQNTHFRPGYISAGTASMTVGLVSGATISNLATANLTQGSSNCTVPSGGGLQCTVAVQAPFGTDVFSISTYGGANATGKVLSTGEVTATLTLGGTVPTVALSLNGVPASVSLAIGQSSLPVGIAGSTSIVVQAVDSSNNLIIGPGLFANPIALAISGDTYGTLALSTTSVTAPGQVVTLSYNGNTNVGSTITPSGTNLTSATGVSFAGSGAVLTVFQYADAANQVYGLTPYDVAAFPSGTTGVLAGDAAVLMNDLYSVQNDYDYQGIVLVGPTGAKQAFVGDTSDYYSPPPSGSLTIPGVTVVHGMSASLVSSEFAYADDDLAAGTNGDIYYSGRVSSSTDPSCTPDPLNSSNPGLSTGTIGVLNPTSGTTQEYVLKGTAGPIKVDSAGNVWWIESTGTCNSTDLLGGSNYAIGELPANSTTPIETQFNAVGLSSIVYPTDMSITPNGSTMYIVDYDSATVWSIATATLASPTSVTANNSADGSVIATAPDGTTMWFSDSIASSQGEYYYGWVPGSAAFSTAGLQETTFPIGGFISYGMAYADGSFWAAGYQSPAGIGRISGLAAGAPQSSYYAMPVGYGSCECECSGSQQLYSLAAGSGDVWAVDDACSNIDVMQYGLQSSGTVTYSATRRIGSTIPRLNVVPRKVPHATNPHPRTHLSRKP